MRPNPRIPSLLYDRKQRTERDVDNVSPTSAVKRDLRKTLGKELADEGITTHRCGLLFNEVTPGLR